MHRDPLLDPSSIALILVGFVLAFVMGITLGVF
jgi:hypothetical protein